MTKRDVEQRAIALLRQALVERESKRLSEALILHNQALRFIRPDRRSLTNGKFSSGLR